MRKLVTILAILVALASPAHAAIWYLLVPGDQVDAIMSRLDTLKGPSPYTLHYTLSIDSQCATVTTCLLPIDDRAQSVLTPEEWASRLATMPTEFIRPMPE